MRRIIHLQQVTTLGAGGYQVINPAACPTGKRVCLSADGDTYCEHIPEDGLVKKIRNNFYLLTCHAPLEDPVWYYQI